MLSFRVEDDDAREVEAWARELGVARSELLRAAVRRYVERLASEHDVALWEAQPLDAGEGSLAEVADWGPAEDWSDWATAAG
jgi:hypothetical protein